MIPGAQSAVDMSPDGRFVVGGLSGQVAQIYLWDRVSGTMTTLPGTDRYASAVSNDGAVVLGLIPNPEGNGSVAAIWRAATNQWTSLGYTVGTPEGCGSLSSGYELNADGSVAVGLKWINGCNGAGFRWTEAGGLETLEHLVNGNNRASVVSDDGSVIAGFAQGSFSRTPAVWGATGVGYTIDPNADAVGEVHGLSDNGAILIGTLDGKATMWTQGGANAYQIGAGSLIPGWEGIPKDIANDGTIIGLDVLGTTRRAWIRPGTTSPIIDLKTYITSLGAVVPAGMNLEQVEAVSADGRFIIGNGLFSGAWLVEITTPSNCPTDLDSDGATGAADLAVLLGAWGAAEGDLDGDGTTGASDLAVLLGGWGPCPAPTGGCCLGSSCDTVTEAECIASGGTYLGDNTPCGLVSCANNDLCADAIDVTANIDGAPVLGDNSFATPGAYTGTDPELPAGSPSCHWSGNPAAAHSTVWYRFTAPDLGMVTISLCESVPAPLFDTSIAMFTGTCGNLVEIGCDEDGCTDLAEPPFFSRLFVKGLVPGQEYYFCIMNSGDWLGSIPGPFEFTITSP
ncbi:MAG: hypothetical protein RLZZ238_1138 [Planctomycetota bacterium]